MGGLTLILIDHWEVKWTSGGLINHWEIDTGSSSKIFGTGIRTSDALILIESIEDDRVPDRLGGRVFPPLV